jgi:glycosyl hydrolase family 2/PKD domain-containing protein
MDMKIKTTFQTVCILLTSSIFLGGCVVEQNESSVVEVQSTDEGYQLVKNGSPYTIYGVGGTTNLELLKAHGGNTIRTWDAEGIEPLMDEAHELGISVVVGIWLEHARHGFDYNEPEAKKEQLDRVEQFVRQFRDHPALLAWGVGNEVELGGTMEGAIMQINDAAALIKSLDTNHPTMAVIAEIGDDKAIRIQNECPDIDMIGINSYGGLGNLATRLESQGVTLPYAITEYGPLGHWESGVSPWGAPYEMSSAAKADFLRSNYTKTIQSNLGKQCLGSFAFLWGQKQEKTATWYGLHLESGETIESVDVLHELWTGEKVDNGAPRVEALNLDADANGLQPGQKIALSVQASDPDGDALSVQWEVVSESTVESMGGDFEEKIDSVPVEIEQQDTLTCVITMPKEAGAYRIFATVRDGNGHAGTANLPVFVAED